MPDGLICKVLIVCTAIAASTSARAEATANVFLEEIGKGDKLMLYVLDGYANGLLWARTAVEVETGFKLYCPPGKLAITPDQNRAILQQHVTNVPSQGELPAGMALLRAYRATFPC